MRTIRRNAALTVGAILSAWIVVLGVPSVIVWALFWY